MRIEILVFILTFLFVFIVYELFFVRKCKKNKELKQPVEVQYLVNKYHLDLNKLKYKRLLNLICVVSAFDIALVVTAISFIKQFYFQLAVGFVLIFMLIFVSYAIVGNYYRKKGCCKHV